MLNLSARWQMICPGWLPCACFLLAAMVSNLDAEALAQRPNNGIKFVDHKADKFAVESLLKAGAALSIKDEEMFDRYFNEYVLPPIARIAGGKTDIDLPVVRADIKRYFRMGNGPPYDRLNRIVRDFMMKQVLRKVPNPDCKVNAVLVLGDLNEFEGSSQKPTKPLPEGLNDLISLLKAPKLPDYLRAAALVGIQRHTLPVFTEPYPLAPEAEVEITKLMLDILKQKNVPPSRTPSGHAYLRRSAGEVLGTIGNPGKDGAIAHAVVATLSETDTPLSCRIGLCNVVGMFKYKPTAKLDYKAIAAVVCYTAIDAAQIELDRAAALGQQQGEIIDPDRRRLGHIFKQAYLALAGTSKREGRIGLANAAIAEGKPDAGQLQSLKTELGKILVELDKAQFVDGKEFAATLAGLQVMLPKRADAGKLPADVAEAKADPGAKKKVSAVPAN